MRQLAQASARSGVGRALRHQRKSRQGRRGIAASEPRRAGKHLWQAVSFTTSRRSDRSERMAAVAIRPATAADAVDIARIYNGYVAGTCITFETEAVSAQEMTRRISA